MGYAFGVLAIVQVLILGQVTTDIYDDVERQNVSPDNTVRNTRGLTVASD